MKKQMLFLRNRVKYGLFLIAVIMTSFVIASNTSAATHTLTLTSSGSQSINVSASSGTAISSDSINVATTCRYGYNFTLSTSVSNNNLYLNGDISNNASGTYFSPVDGSTALNAATNTWGYYYNSNASITPTSTSVFSPVPTLSSPATIRTPLTTPASSNINDNFKIYYGVNSAPEMKVGTYKMIPDTNNSNNDGTLIYTATIADSCMRYTVHFSPTSIFEGNTLSGTGTMSDQSIYEGIATPLATNGFIAPSDYYFDGWNTTQDGTGISYTNGQSVTDLTTVGNTITLYAQWKPAAVRTILYDAVAGMTKGTLSANNIDLLDDIVTPTQEAPVSSNSGVYTYNGSHSDSSSTKTVYFYRGILDTFGNTNTYGSRGLSDAYPSYVVLSSATSKSNLSNTDTCWRIVRTTGSGGVKMIYNGKWTGSTCANSALNANAVSSVYFNRGTSDTSCSSSNANCGTLGFITYAGYNYNSTYAYNHTGYTSAISNSTLFNNNTKSNARIQTENWYADNLTSYTNLLETSAGWCDDRTVYDKNGITNTTIPYKASAAVAYFGAERRLFDNAEPTLQCRNATNNDLLSTSNGLTYPIALLTADEAVLAGCGEREASAYHEYTFMYAGRPFWLLSPAARDTGGYIHVYHVQQGGYLGHGNVSDSYSGIRPTISLKTGATSVNGSGIATDPWIVNP